jgi:hypothetical protein
MNEAKKIIDNGFDLDLLASDPTQNTHKVDVAWDDDGNPTAGFIIVSKDSAQYRAKAAELRASGIKRGAIKSQRIDTKTEEGAKKLDSIMQDNELELAISATVGIYGFKKGGQAAEYSEALVRDLYTKKPTWREKVSAALEVEANFLPTSSTTSSSSPEPSGS